MNIMYLTDLHGAARKYDRSLEIAQSNGISLIINGGDLFPSFASGFQTQSDFIANFFANYLLRVEEAGIAYACMAGNDDLGIFDTNLKKVCELRTRCFLIDGKNTGIGDIEIIGLNLINDTPFKMKDRCRLDYQMADIPRQSSDALISENGGWNTIHDWEDYISTLPTISEELQRLPKPESMDKAIYVIHAPPSGLGLDHTQGGLKAGSDAVRDFLQAKGPRLSLHGHIHESPDVSGVWKEKLGNTTCVQPGQRGANELSIVYINSSSMDTDREIIRL